MDYKILLQKKEYYEQIKDSLPEITVKSYAKAFELEYTHHSTAIEGNTLTLLETKVVLEDGLSVGGKMLREIYEVINHNKAYQYVKDCIAQKKSLDEQIIKDLHAILMENIMFGGIYRNVDVYISGAAHTPPSPSDMYRQVKAFYLDLQDRAKDNVVELAAWTHAEFVRIHPFADGNGRTSRLIMNYQLMANGFLPVSIAKENRLEYFNVLEAYAVKKDIKPFADMIATLEQQQLDRYLGMAKNREQT
ncbi:Fic/DOC family protein [Lacrimispora xylanisolvens]|uniref:Fic/DOC family protein n=1 Tax=Lacrimispora xylanisolvens TaxID=384636 RepID=A0A2S6HS69_9FIRM|nr:Fic family protein [Hungatella xylanolytica]MBE5986354.1 Fic family protein [Paenibacillaceae bacterium]PPK80527.1 Fic/DOC family protein [Hungatella xylanolytica]